MDETTTRGQVSRRTIAKGMAWAAPAIPVVAMAPAAAASPGCVPTITFGPGSCKCPGQSTGQPWGYYVRLCNTGTVCDPNDDGLIYVTIRTNTGQNPIVGGPFAVPVNGCTGVLQFNSANSANFLRLYYAETAAGSALTTAPYLTVNSPPDCTAGDLGTCTAAASTAAVEPSLEGAGEGESAPAGETESTPTGETDSNG